MQSEPVLVTAVAVRDFRSYSCEQIKPGEGLTVISGPNGAGKTNLLEALYFGCVGRSCRTTNEREVVRWGAAATRVEVEFSASDGRHRTSVGFAPGQPKHLQVDGARVERMNDAPVRPLVNAFLPERLELIKGPPASRRAHLDQVVMALWPARSSHRQAYAQALAQRNALISRIRAGAASSTSLPSWNSHLARHGIELMRDREQAVAAVAGACETLAQDLGLSGGFSLSYRPRSKADAVEQLYDELEARTGQDLERGFTTHGPHRDELGLAVAGRELRTYGSQGQQRAGLLALLLAERQAIAMGRGAPPVMLLDDVTSELDRERRVALVELLRDSGQSLITTTDLEHVPGAERDDVVRLEVAAGRVSAQAAADRVTA